MPSAAEPQAPSPESVLEALTQQRLLDLSRTFGIGLRSGRETKALNADALLAALKQYALR